MSEFPVFYILVLFFTAIIGSSFIFIRQIKSPESLRLLLSFSAAYLLGLCLLHLFPELYEVGISGVGWYVLGGFILQVILDFFSHGIEHGHSHSEQHKHEHSGTKFLVLLMISLWIHAFIEGMPFGGDWSGGAHDHAHVHDHAHHQHHDHRDSLLLGISLHKLTEAFVFASLLISTGMARSRAWLLIVLFALIAPAGAVVQHLLGTSGIVNPAEFTPKITAVLIGIMLHISTTIIFESSEGHRFNLKKFVAILLGIGTSVLAAHHF